MNCCNLFTLLGISLLWMQKFPSPAYSDVGCKMYCLQAYIKVVYLYRTCIFVTLSHCVWKKIDRATVEASILLLTEHKDIGVIDVKKLLILHLLLLKICCISVTTFFKNISRRTINNKPADW